MKYLILMFFVDAYFYMFCTNMIQRCTYIRGPPGQGTILFISCPKMKEIRSLKGRTGWTDWVSGAQFNPSKNECEGQPLRDNRSRVGLFF
jgi:hypothetical protein